jgi:uncharacterized protein (DUF427 family)
MNPSPGHRKWPDHKVRGIALPQDVHVTVRIGGETIADSRHAIRLEEDGHPARLYLPRSDVRMERLERSQTSSHCPFKGTARYFTLRAGGRTLEDAVWSYEEPYDEHADLKDRVAFYDDRYRDIEVSAS